MLETADRKQRHAFAFTGEGGEYFRIWIVNLALTLLTLGIYSAWAKVRRLQYFYRNTSVAGASFDYHGDPIAILKGRAIGVALLLVYQFSGGISPVAGLVALAVLALVLPWLIQRSLRFKLANSSYRGLRFRFAGGPGGAYQAFLLWPALGYLTLGLLWPMAHWQIKRYQHNHSRYGTTPFTLEASLGGFYGLYLKLLGLLVVPLILVTLIAMTLLASYFGDFASDWENMVIGSLYLVLAFYVIAMVMVGPWLAARLQNLVWNGTRLGSHGFSSAVRARDLLVIYLTNFLGILLTLGLYKPFADIRLARYRLQHMALLAEDDLDSFIADQAQTVNAAGEETAEVFDVDISF